MKGIKANTEYQGKWTGSKRKERKAARKQRIIEAFTTDNDVEVIPAEYDIKPVEAKILRVAAYARVSTDQESQADSYQTQKEYYKKYITNHDGWEYVDTYADEGRSGTNVLKREHFKEMIEDCKAGHIDLIITKDIRRFARNVLDCLSYVRMLKSLNPPVGVYFEDEHLNTLDRGNEAILALLSSVAQGESENKSEAIKSARPSMSASIKATGVPSIFTTAMSANSVIGEPDLPVRATTVTPLALAALAAATMFLLVPEVVMAISTSLSVPIASIQRENTCS